MKDLEKRLAAAEERVVPNYGALGLFTVKDGMYINVFNQKAYTGEEHVELVNRHTETAFYALDPDREDHPHPSTTWTIEDIRKQNAAMDLAEAEGRPYDPVTDPDPRVRELEAQEAKYKAEERERLITSWPHREEMLRRGGRHETIAANKEMLRREWGIEFGDERDAAAEVQERGPLKRNQ